MPGNGHNIFQERPALGSLEIAVCGSLRYRKGSAKDLRGTRTPLESWFGAALCAMLGGQLRKSREIVSTVNVREPGGT